MIEKMLRLQREVEQRKPLIHCITNPISIHDCANIILAAGGRPIMAEHPKEAAQITAEAQALLLNLGNITDVRMESMEYSLKEAEAKGIPVVLDLVGVACSSLRLSYAVHLLKCGHISILKGNMSELLALTGQPSHGTGIDVGEKDLFSAEDEEVPGIFRRFAGDYQSVLLASGQTDLIADGEEVYLVSNGVEMLSKITGTGCMLGALCAVYLSCGDPLQASLLGTAVMGIAGERAARNSRGPGSFQNELLDQIYGLKDVDLSEGIKIRKMESR